MSGERPSCLVVPGPEYPNGFEALSHLISVSSEVDAAVAFVTHSGVDALEALLSVRSVSMRLTARGAPITQPSALVRLADLGVEVSVIVGARAAGFHPKLWVGEGDGNLYVLAGSGNLTEGGLRGNAEQAEYWRLGPEEKELQAQHRRRLDDFVSSAVRVGEVQGTGFWKEWEKAVAKREAQDRLDLEAEELLARQGEAASAEADLFEDLYELYERTKAEVRIPVDGGGDRPYVASRFKQAIDRAKLEGGLTAVVARIVKSPTEGFEHLAKANRDDLMIETAVLDETKSYHHLFSQTTKDQARATMDAFYASRAEEEQADE